MNKHLQFILITFLLLLGSRSVFAQNYVSSSFDATTFPPTGWSANVISGSGSFASSFNWVRTTSGISGPTGVTPHSGAGMAGYNSYWINSGSAELVTPAMNFATYTSGANQASFWFYYTGASDRVDVYINTSATSSGGTLLGSVYGYSPGASGWKQYTYTLPTSFSSSSSVYIIFKAVSAYGDDLLIDDVSVDHIGACSGAAAVSISSVSKVCAGNSFTMTATTTPSLITGVAFQWQSSSSATGPWTTIAGATNTSYTTSISGTTYFRCVDTCRSVGAISLSNVDTVTLNTAALCPCNPAYYYSTYYGIPACSYNITNFTCTGTPPSTLSDGFLSCGSSGTASYSGYYDRTFDTVKLTQGGTYSGNINFSYGYYSGYGIWVDFNDDGTFSSSELLVFNQRGSGGGLPTSYSLPIPITAATGPHRLRVRYVYTGSSLSSTQSFRNTIDPCVLSTSSPTCCDYYYEGAARDYVVNILQAPACSGTPTVSVVPAGPQNLCSGVTDTLTASTGAPVTGLAYQWQSSNSGGVSWSNISGATNAAYIFTVSSSLWYRCVVTCTNSGLSANSNIVIVNMKAVCPCTPTYYYGSPSSSYNMYNVNISGYSGSNINDNPPTSTATGYSDRTGVVAPLNVLQGGSYTGTLSFHYYYQSAAVWIDFNDDGVFSSGELMAGPTASTSCCSYITTRSITINIPATAATGKHLMRVRDVYICCSTPAAIDPCTVGSTYYYGNTADYLVNVQGTVPLPTLSATSQNICAGSTLSITATTTDTGSLTYHWTGPNGFVSNTTTTATSNTINLTGTAFANSGIYTVRVTSAGGTSSPVTDTVSVWPYPVFTSGNPSNNSPVCTPVALMLSGNADPANASWSWTGPSAYTSTSVNPVLSPTSASMSGTYTLTVSNHGCNTTGSTTAIVYQTPSIASITGTNPTSCTCNCGSFVLGGLNASTAYTVAYQKNGVSITPVSKTTDASGNLTVSGLSAAIYSNITVTLNACPSAPVTVTLTNPSGPATPVASSNSPVCQGSTLSFSATDATSGVSWSWLGPNGFSSTIASPSISNTPFIDSGTYYVYVTDGSGCTSPVVPLNVSVKPVPANPTASSNAPVCQGSRLTLFANSTTPGATYTWSGPSSYTSTAQNPVITSVPASASGVYTVYSVLNGCSSFSPATTNVYVKWTPGVPSLTTNSPICAGMGYNPNTLILNVSDTSSGVTYSWSGPNAFLIYFDSSTRQLITNPPGLDSGIYTVYATLNGCNSASASQRVVIKSTPQPPAITPKFIKYCQYDIAAPITATGTNIHWYTASTGGVSLPSATPTPSDSVAGLFVYYATQTVGGCESQPNTDTVFVKTKPLPPAASATYTFCQGDNATPLNAIGVNLLWYTTAIGGTGSPVTPVPSTAAAGTFDYYVTQTVNGCESDRKHIAVTVKPKPNPPTVTTPVIYCQGDIATPLSAGGVNLLWYTGPTGIGSPIAPTPVTSYPDSAYYYVTQTVNGCQSNKAEIDVYTYYKPNAVIVGSAPYVCQYDTLSFTYYGNGTMDAAYNWTMPKGASIIGGYGQGPIVARFDSAGHYKVLLQVDNHGCKSPMTSYTVDVRLAPIVPVVVNNQVCQGDLLNVSTGRPNETIDNYNWNFDGADVVYGANGAGPYGIKFATQGMYVIKLIATANLCPSAPILDTVYVHPLADAHIQSASSTNICAGDSVHFIAESYDPAYLYQWQPASYFQNITNAGSVYGFVDRSGFVKLQVTTEYGCTSSDSVQINAQACCDMFFPNAFTPNGDGKNDVFRPLSNGRQQISDFRVMNRWGQTIFESVDQRRGWDGKAGGVPQDVGTYYYYIKYTCANGKIYEQRGELVLLR